MTPEEIEELFRRRQGVVVPEDGDEDDAILTEEEKAYRIAHLRAVLLEAHNAWVSGSDDLDRIAEKLGDGSRYPLWRSPIGASGLLSFFLGILPTPGLRLPLKIHALRLIGNSCADTDENRNRVVESNRLGVIIDLLADESLLAFVIPVLYNVMVDYEPAQLRACEARLSERLVDILGGPRLEACRAFLNIICKILGLLIAQDPEIRNGPPATPSVLLSVATNRQIPADLEDFCGLTSVALSYLSHESFQEYVLAGMPLLLTSFSMSYTHFDPGQAAYPDDAAQLKRVRNAFVTVLADISALPNFANQLHSLSDPVFQTFVSWLHGPSDHTNLQTAACLSLGNLARSDATCTMFVRDAQIHVPLIALLTRLANQEAAPPSQLLHAIMSFLKNLAIPIPNKQPLGHLLESNVLPKLWTTTDTQPQTQFAAVSLTRLLLVGCPPNVRRLCAPLSADPDSPAHDRSNLHILTALFDRVDAEPTKVEAARAIATVCRILHSAPVNTVLPEEWSHYHAPANPSPSGSSSLSSPLPTSSPAITTTTTTAPAAAAASSTRRARFYAAHDLSNPLGFLVKQTRFPALRSEAWFVFALMSRSADGARAVQAALQSFEAARALFESITGRDMADGHDLLLAASSSPAADGQQGDDDEFMAGLRALREGGSGSGVGGVVVDPPGELASSAVAAMGIEGLGLEPQQADPAQQASMARIDRENGLCMVAELLKNYSADLLPLRKSMYENLLFTGGEMVLHQREEAKRRDADMTGMQHRGNSFA